MTNTNELIAEVNDLLDENADAAQEKLARGIFTDQQGRDWQIKLNVGMATRLRDEAACDVVNTANGSVFQALATDWLKLGMALWIVCEEQADDRQVTEEEFAKLLEEKTLASAVTAMENAIVNFSPTHRRPAMRAIIDRLHDSMTKTSEQEVKMITGKEADRYFQQQMGKHQAKIKKALGELAAGS